MEVTPTTDKAPSVVEKTHPILVVVLQFGVLSLIFACILALAAGARLWDSSLGLPLEWLYGQLLQPLPHLPWDQEVQFRITWATLNLVFVAIALAMVVNAVRISVEVHRRHQAASRLWTVAILGSSAGLVAIASFRWRAHWGPKVWGDLLDSIFQPRGMEGVLQVLGFTLGLGYACAFLMLAGCCMALVAPEGDVWSPDELRPRLSWIRTQLLFGASLLTLGVMDIGVIGRWMAAYFPDASTRLAITNSCDSMTVGVGVVCSALLTCAYIPPALVLRGIAGHLAPGESATHKREWLEENGFGLAPQLQSLRIAATLAPALLGSMLPGWVGALMKNWGR